MSALPPGTRLWLIGAGNMGGAMLARWIECGVLPADHVTVIDPGAPAVPAGVRLVDAIPAGESPDILVLAVKPQLLDRVAPTLADLRPGVLISILAGVEGAVLAARISAAATVRAMPNLPVSLGLGVVALHSHDADEAARTRVEALLAPLGLIEWIGDEAMFHAVTALSGSGPGFVYRFIEALAVAGVSLGLPEDQAERLAIATVQGATVLAAASADPPARLADRVASAGGVTRAGLNVLDEGDAMKTLLTATLTAATRRSEEMAQEAR